jgi:hypothetical protein
MRVQLRRFAARVPTDALARALTESGAFDVEDLDREVDLTECLAVIEGFRTDADGTGRSRGPEADARLARPLYAALSPALDRRLATDPRVWHWLSTSTQLREYVWLRWHGMVPAVPQEALTQAGLATRFLGSASINGQMRNALSRIFLTVETLCNGLDDIDQGISLAESALKNADLHLQLFERELSLHPAVARAAVRAFHDWKGEALRAPLIRLNRLATTLVIEDLDDEAAFRLLTGN